MHTYGWVLKNSSQGEGFWKTLHRERGFEKPFTGREVLKNPSQGGVFWKTLHRERGFEKPFTGRGVLKNPSQAEGFWQTLHRESGFEKPYIHTYMLSIHTYMLSIHTYIAVLKNSSQGEGFWNAYLQQIADFCAGMYVSKVLCVWRVFWKPLPLWRVADPWAGMYVCV